MIHDVSSSSERNFEVSPEFPRFNLKAKEYISPKQCGFKFKEFVE